MGVDGMRLVLGQNKWIDIEYIGGNIYQVREEHNCRIEVVIGDLIRQTNRGWEVFNALNMNAPKFVIPTRAKLENDEEE
tara:strand:- start:218 stop:454 length:237 start_codon:yes stop_codon:yes gene_type:complete